MRAFGSALLGLCAGLVLWMPPALAEPAGSYLATCRDVEVRQGRDLEAHCETLRPGAFRATRLDDFASCQGDIANHGGTLSCERRGPPPGPRPTAAAANSGGLSIRKSCTGIKLKDGVVSAFCRARNGRWHAAVLDLAGCRPGGEITNRDGALACDPRPSSWPPPGTYLLSCRNAVVAEGWLAAECRDAQGQWQRTRINLVPCRGRPDIANRDGLLACD